MEKIYQMEMYIYTPFIADHTYNCFWHMPCTYVTYKSEEPWKSMSFSFKWKVFVLHIV